MTRRRRRTLRLPDSRTLRLPDSRTLGPSDSRTLHEADPTFAGDGAIDGLGNERRGAGANDEVQAGEAAEKLVGHALGHAAHDADDAAWALALGGAEQAELAHGLVFGLGADAARVDEHDVGLVLGGGPRDAAALQERADGLAIAHVHLASVGVDVVFHRRFPKGKGRPSMGYLAGAARL